MASSSLSDREAKGFFFSSILISFFLVHYGAEAVSYFQYTTACGKNRGNIFLRILNCGKLKQISVKWRFNK
ncbi:hypothetical protein CLOSTHATH_05731 [Hungatella hathewayi DSM 13479]|uniref:Uncharacterized protein n=1 Tax=Hungatella hathewayi DSM 13479 TaxID=566550 RepID=D3AQ26_9FIRM|nr:hypothetical protein CLOSTHATH_05731 [Hungatella hathewayi DSM 13479]